MPHHAELPLWEHKSDAQKIETMRRMIDDLYEVTYAEAKCNLKKILQDAKPYDDKERADITTMLEMLEKYPNIMSQNCEVGHFTGSALVCDNQGRVLLHYHKNLKRWLQFGGHADNETDFAKVAMRETKEETGLEWLQHYPIKKQIPVPIDFDIHTIPARKNRPEHLHLDIRYLLMTSYPDSLNPAEGESKDFIWASFDEFLNPADPSDAELLDSSLKRLIRKCKDRYHNLI